MNWKANRPTLLLLLISGVTFICLGIWVIYNLYLDAPAYEILTIPSPTSQFPNGGWYKEERTVRTRGLENESDKFFMWRVEDILTPSMIGKNQHFLSEVALVEHYLTWFKNNGWDREDISFFDYCSFLPESKFLQPNQYPGYFAFRRPDASLDGYEPTACFAAWRDEENGRYYVVVSTQAPSLRTDILRCWEVDCRPKKRENDE